MLDFFYLHGLHAYQFQHAQISNLLYPPRKSFLLRFPSYLMFEEISCKSRNPKGSLDCLHIHHMRLSFFLTSKYLPLFYIATAVSQLQILIISYHSSLLIVLIHIQHHFVPTVSDAQVIFLRGKTHQITSLQNIFQLLFKFTGLSSNLLGDFERTLDFFACFSCSISSDIQKTISDQWYCSF